MRAALGDRLTGFELISADCVALDARAVSGAARPAARTRLVRARSGRRCRGQLVALSRRSKRALAEAISDEIARDATIAQSEAQAAALWALREHIPEAQRLEGPNMKHDISVPVSRIPAFLDQARAGARRRVSRRALRRVRPSGRRQPALQPVCAARRRSRRVHRRHAERANRIVYDLVAEARRQFQRRARRRTDEA